MHANLPLAPPKAEYLNEEVLSQLERILSSKIFANSTVLCNFLRFIVEETLKENTSGLKEYTIGVSALGKPTDFNPQTDAIVRIHAGRLRRILKEYYSGPGVSDPIRIEVVKGTYVPVFRSQTVEKPNGKAEENKAPTAYTRTKLTLAVLPFRNLCPDDTYQFFVEGFGEELTRVFASGQGIAVIAHHSARKYHSAITDMRLIGSELGVHYLITGTVRRSSKEVRINVGLSETMNSRQIWNKSYKYTLNAEKLIDIQDQIVDDVFAILGGYYGLIMRDSMDFNRNASPSSLQSFDAVLWNYYFHMNFSLEAYLKTREALETALLHEPNNATVLAMLAELYLSAYSLGYPTVEDAVKTGYQMTKKATEIDPQCQRAFLEHGWACIYVKNKEEAVHALEHCLSLNPSSAAFTGSVGFDMACAGEYKRAYTLLTQSLNLNPHCPWWFHLGFFLVHYHNGQYKKALEHAEKIETTDVFLDPLIKVAAKGQMGLIAEAQTEIQKLSLQFDEIMADLNTHLNTFLLDNDLVDKIIDGTKKAGLSLA